MQKSQGNKETSSTKVNKLEMSYDMRYLPPHEIIIPPGFSSNPVNVNLYDDRYLIKAGGLNDQNITIKMSILVQMKRYISPLHLTYLCVPLIYMYI